MTKKKPNDDYKPELTPVKNDDGTFRTTKGGMVEFTTQGTVTHTR